MTTNDREVAEAQIRTLVDDRARAIRAKDINRSVSNYAPDVLLFDVVNPLRYAGSHAVRKRVAEWFSLFQGAIGYEIRDLSIATGDGVAFSHHLYGVSGVQDAGKIDMWVRATVCYRELDGKWMITHEHESVPFDVNSGKASLDLEP